MSRGRGPVPEIASNGIRMRYEVQGEGPPAVLIAGLSYGLWTWRWVAPLLARSHRVITFDNRGIDGTDKPPGPYSGAMLAQDTLGLMDALDLPPCAVAGLSMGGMVAQELALARPDRVARLALLATNFGGPNCLPPTAPALAAMTDRSGGPRAIAERGLKVNSAPDFPARHPDRVADYFRYREAINMTGESYLAQLQVGLGHNAEARLHALKMPVLILQGDQDVVVPPGNAELLARRIPQAQVRVLPGAGHFLPMERPEEVADLLAAFFSGKPAPRGS